MSSIKFNGKLTNLIIEIKSRSTCGRDTLPPLRQSGVKYGSKVAVDDCSARAGGEAPRRGFKVMQVWRLTENIEYFQELTVKTLQ